MTFREWFINESALSHAEKLYHRFLSNEIELDELEPIVAKITLKLYNDKGYDFDYDTFQQEVLNAIDMADGESIKEIVVKTSKRMQEMDVKKRIKHGIKKDDEEQANKHDKAAKIIATRPIIPEPVKLLTTPEPVKLLPAPEPSIIPVKSKPKHPKKKPWQVKFNFEPPDHFQRKLF